MVVILFVVAAVAAIATPMADRMKNAAERRAFRDHLRAFALEARQRAIAENQTYLLTFEESENQFSSMPESGESDARTLVLPKGIAFNAGTMESGSGTYQVSLYPDGTAEGGIAELDEGGRTLYLKITSANAEVQLGEGEPPDQTVERWSAGTYEQRL